MNKRFFLAVNVAAIGVVLSSGCAPTSPRYDSHFGESVRMLTAQQTINPDAGSKQVPEAMEGAAARETIVGYRDSFRDPPAPQNTFTIGVGSGSNSGGSR